MMQDLAGIVRTDPTSSVPPEGLAKLKSARRRSGSPATASTIRGGTPRWTSATVDGLRRDRDQCAGRKESRGGHFRDDYPE
jgi:succinate dehydrogenase/fumarate reductase flavoprotein subunit